MRVSQNWFLIEKCYIFLIDRFTNIYVQKTLKIYRLTSISSLIIYDLIF